MYLVNLKIQFVVVFFHLSLDTKGGFFLNILGIGMARFYSLLSFERTVATAREGGGSMWALCDLFYLRWFLIDKLTAMEAEKARMNVGAPKGCLCISHFTNTREHAPGCPYYYLKDLSKPRSVHYKGGARDVPYRGGK
jgi:hypothetical protein